MKCFYKIIAGVRRRLFRGKVSKESAFALESDASGPPTESLVPIHPDMSARVIPPSSTIETVLHVRGFSEIAFLAIERISVFVVNLLPSFRFKNEILQAHFRATGPADPPDGIKTAGDGTPFSGPIELGGPLKILGVDDSVLALRERDKSVSLVERLDHSVSFHAEFKHRSSLKGLFATSRILSYSFAVLALFFCASPARSQCPTQTPNVGFQVPNLGNVTTWGLCLNGDLSTLDNLLGGSAAFPVATATAPVNQHANWVTANVSPQTVTNITGGYAGQTIHIICGVSDTFTTIAASATINVATPWSCPASKSITLTYIGTVWTEIGRGAPTATGSVTGCTSAGGIAYENGTANTLTCGLLISFSAGLFKVQSAACPLTSIATITFCGNNYSVAGGQDGPLEIIQTSTTPPNGIGLLMSNSNSTGNTGSTRVTYTVFDQTTAGAFALGQVINGQNAGQMNFSPDGSMEVGSNLFSVGPDDYAEFHTDNTGDGDFRTTVPGKAFYAPRLDVTHAPSTGSRLGLASIRGTPYGNDCDGQGDDCMLGIETEDNTPFSIVFRNKLDAAGTAAFIQWAAGQYEFGSQSSTNLVAGRFDVGAGTYQLFTGTGVLALTVDASQNAAFPKNLTASTFSTTTNCSNAASPAVCGSAATGVVAVPAGATPTLQINTSAVTSVSRILLAIDESATIAATTCNTTLATLVQPVITARNPGVSFTIQINATLAVNPACVSYLISD